MPDGETWNSRLKLGSVYIAKLLWENVCNNIYDNTCIGSLLSTETNRYFIIKWVASNKSSLLMKIDLQNTQTLQIN